MNTPTRDGRPASTAARMSPPAAEPPRVVHIACTLWIIGLIVGLIGQYLLSPLTDLTAARARVLASNTSGLTRQQIDTAVTLSVVGAMAFAIVLAVVDGLVLTKMRAGRRWARPTLTGLAVLGGHPAGLRRPCRCCRSPSTLRRSPVAGGRR